LFRFHKCHDNRNDAGTDLITTLTINFANISSRSCVTAAVKGGTQANYLKENPSRLVDKFSMAACMFRRSSQL
jgi:hypothetical protein